MKFRYLAREEITQLDLIYLEALKAIEDLRMKNPTLGKHVALPRLPNTLSESIAAHTVRQCFGSTSKPFKPSGLSDLGVRDSGGRKRLVAVKGTGTSCWITITATDLLADSLVWVDYSRRLTSRAVTVDVWHFFKPVSSWSGQRKTTFSQAVKSHGKPNRHFYRFRQTISS